MKQFCRRMALFALPVLLVLGLFLGALVRSHELGDQAVAAQKAAAGQISLFGMAYRSDLRSFKYTVASQRNPQFLVLGTSRAMQMRSEYFQVEGFYNGGGGAAHISEYLHFLKSLPTKPRQVLLVLDQYFYNDHYEGQAQQPTDYSYTFTEASLGDALQRALRDYGMGKYRLWDVYTAPRDAWGLSAAARGAGFLPDGAYSYGRLVDQPETGSDVGFKETLARVAAGNNRFQYGDTVSAYALEETRQLLAYCQDTGIQVVAVLPPYAPTVWQAMVATGGYGYIDALYPALAPLFAQYGAEVYDFTYMPDTTDDQFIDGFHGSDRVYAGIAAHLADQSPLLSPYLDSDFLWGIFQKKGNPLAVDLP